MAADQPDPKNLLPSLIDQNPSPDETDSQDRKNAVRSQVDRILSVFAQILPSNYVARVPGPSYSLQFQALAEQIASFQITAQEVFADASYEYTRTEFLYQLLGALVFPDAELEGYPEIPGDLSYREFLRRMVGLLLQGSTATTVKQGVELLTDADVEVIERGVVARAMKGRSAWGEDDKHVIEINVSKKGVPYTVASGDLIFNGITSIITPIPSGTLRTTDYEVVYTMSDSTVLQTPEKTLTGFKTVAPYVYGLPSDPITVPYEIRIADSTFPSEPFRLQRNVHLVLRALKPAHVIYDYRHLLKDAFGTLFTESVSWAFQDYHYQDLRQYWGGAKLVGGPDDILDPPGRRQVGIAGVTHTDRTLFSDPNISFWSIRPGTRLTILSGANSLVVSPVVTASEEGYFDNHVGRYRVLEVRAFPTDRDTTPRAYTTVRPVLPGVPPPSPVPPIVHLSGFATVEGNVITDPLQDWSLAEEGEMLTFATGPNAGTYRLDTVLGTRGGPLGAFRRIIGSSTRVQVSPGILRVYPRMAKAATGQEYEVFVDRLGVQRVQYVYQESVTMLPTPPRPRFIAGSFLGDSNMLGNLVGLGLLGATLEGDSLVLGDLGDNVPAAYGFMYFTVGALTIESGSLQKVLGGTALGPVLNVTDDGGVSNRLKYTGIGVRNFSLTVTISMELQVFSFPNYPAPFTIGLFKNGVEDLTFRTGAVWQGLGETVECSTTGLISLTPGDYIEIWATGGSPLDQWVADRGQVVIVAVS